MSMFDNLKDKAADALNQNADKVEELSDQALDKAEQLADERVGDKVGTDKIDQGREFIDGKIGNEG